MDRNYGAITFFSKIFTLRRPGVAIFADIIKIVTKFIKTILEDSEKLVEKEIIKELWNLYLYFLI